MSAAALATVFGWTLASPVSAQLQDRFEPGTWLSSGSIRESVGVSTVGLNATMSANPDADHLSPAVVVGLATLNTVVPIAAGASLLHAEKAEAVGVLLLGYGWVAGPAPFNLYFGDTTGGLVGLGIRGSSILIAGALTTGGTWDEDGSAGTEIALLGLFVVSGLTAVLNLVDLPPAVRAHYDSGGLTVAPAVMREGLGLRVSLSLGS